MVCVTTTPPQPVGAPSREPIPIVAPNSPRSVEHLNPTRGALRNPIMGSIAHSLTLPIAGDVAIATQLAKLQEQFHQHTGAKVVFSRKELSEGTYYDSLPPLSLERQVRAAEIAVREAQKYPQGFLAKIGLKTFGIFEACISQTNDGFHEYDPRYGGYRWYGLYNFGHGAVGAYYSDAQLPLTIHHEIFHAVDAHLRGEKQMRHYESDNLRFAQAIQGDERYPALPLGPTTLSELKKIGRGFVLQDAVSAYTTKSPDEDQAEAARHFMMNIPDSLIQAVERPQLPGSQRILHILDQYRTCVENGPDASWFAAIALGTPQSAAIPSKAPPPPNGTAPDTTLNSSESEDPSEITRSLLATITNEKRAFIVRGTAVDDYQPNLTLQGDIRSFATKAKLLAGIQEKTNSRYKAEDDVRELLGLLEAYEGFMTLNYKVSKETRKIFKEARQEILDTLPERPRRELLPRLFNWHYLGKVDRTIHSAFAHKPNVKEIASTIRSVQPAVVLVNRASGFNINADGTILTNAHVTKELGTTMKVQFPNGEIFDGECTHIDDDIDLALVKLKGVRKPLPFVRFSNEEAPVGSDIVLIGQPDTYDSWHVSTGKIINYHPHPHTAVDGYPLGGIEHNGWTFWGNSGSPIFNLKGLVVGTHNTYDDKRNMRCGVRYQPTIDFLKRAKATFELGR